MDNIFLYALQNTIVNEGGLSNHKLDLGKLTYAGISLKFLEDGKIDVNNDGSIDQEDILSLMKDVDINNINDGDKIYDIYKKYFWDNSEIPKLLSFIQNNQIKKYLGFLFFDAAVLYGKKGFGKILQKTLNTKKLNHGAFLMEDGIIGAKTIKTFKSTFLLFNEKYLLDEILYSFTYYKLCRNGEIVIKNPTLKDFKKGWDNRSYAVYKKIEKGGY